MILKKALCTTIGEISVKADIVFKNKVIVAMKFL